MTRTTLLLLPWPVKKHSKDWEVMKDDAGILVVGPMSWDCNNSLLLGPLVRASEKLLRFTSIAMDPHWLNSPSFSHSFTNTKEWYTIARQRMG